MSTIKRLVICCFVLAFLCGPALADFPTISNITTSVQDSNTETDQPILLNPTIAAGDLIIVVGGTDLASGGTLTWDNTTAGTWNELWNAAGTNFVRGAAYAKIADGSEDGVTITPTTSAGEKSTWASLLIPAAGWFGNISTGLTATSDAPTGTTATPDPPSVTPSWGTDDNLIIAVAQMDTGDHTISGWSLPDNNTEVDEGTAGGTITLVSSDELTASPTDPGAYTSDLTDERVTGSIAVRPTAAPAGDSIVLIERSRE